MEKKAFWWILFIVLVSVMTGIVLFPLYKKKNARMMVSFFFMRLLCRSVLLLTYFLPDNGEKCRIFDEKKRLFFDCYQPRKNRF